MNHALVLEWECWLECKWEGERRFYCWVLRLYTEGWRREVEVRANEWGKERGCCWTAKGVNTWVT